MKIERRQETNTNRMTPDRTTHTGERIAHDRGNSIDRG